MYIRQIIIQGFKSYKDQTVIEPFSPRHNVVVGRNGSGKSNFFSAIRFVLSDAYTSMGREERQALLHEGAGPATMSAYVEVIFDNADNRFPTGKDEVILRRTIGLKKDEYTLDKKSASKAEVMNLLEAAGFSRSNPYFIVPQGRIAALTNAKDPERLALLKEIAGTEVYEKRRVESLKIIDETVTKREKISKLLEDIEDRLKELEAEKQELKEYQENDKERRCLEYTIYSREMAEVNESLEKVEEERLRESEVIYECETQFAAREQAITDADIELRSHQQALDVISIEKNRLTEDKQELLMEVARLELEVHDLEKSVRAAESGKAEAIESLRNLNNEIKHNTANLEYEQPFFRKALVAEEEVKEKLHKSNAALEALYGKQGRIVHFRNKKERDQFLQREIANIHKSIVDENTQAAALKDDLEKAIEKRNKLECEIKELEEELRAGKNAAVEIESTMGNIRKIRDEMTDKRKELWRQEAVLAARVKTDKDEVMRAEYALRGTMEKSVAQGLPMVAKIAEKLCLDGVYGPLYELFEVPERYRAAVETIGNKSLFNVVVDTDETAARILEEMNRDRHSDRAGRVTFMPMNRIKVRPQQYPDSKECLPMIKRLRFDPKFEKAFQAVFGKAIICPNLGIASQFSRTHKLSAVTLDGDQADRKGAITGGYRDQQNSRLSCAEKLREWRKTLCEDSQRHADVLSQIAVADQEISSAVGDLNNRESQLRRLVKAREQHNIDLACRRRALALTKEMLVGREKALAKVETGIRQLEEQVWSYQGEMDGEFGTGLSLQEQERLNELVDESGKLRNQLVGLSEERAKWELKINAYKNALEVNLHPRLRDLEAKLEQEDNTSRINEHLKEKERELSVSRERIAETNLKLQSREKNAEAEAVHVTRIMQQLEGLKVAQQESATQMERAQKGSEKYLSRRSVLLHKKEECTRNIRDLGVLPEEAFEKHTRTSSQKLLKKLHKINESLKKFAHVNKKALEQYNSFTKQRDALLNRKKELDSGSKAIDKLIKTLDQQKDEAIQRTFKQVARYFSQVFEKLVPAGRGSLIMQRRIDEEAEDDEDGDHHNPVNGIDSYSGISIKVSFNSKTDEGLRMQQLSGGQKSLVSLALIFAIQRCDPAPFYLFDEIDANLDAAHRTAVANMIHELADNAQFITTTFRPEMLSKADKFYGVMFNKKVSRISCITREDALDFVQQEQPQ